MEKSIYEMDKSEIALFIKDNQDQNKDGYIIKNRGYITASKLKMFEKSPEAYFIKYILEMPLPADEEDEKTALKLGTAIDDYISYWELEFYKKYHVQEKKLLKPDLVALCEEQGLDPTGTVSVLEDRLFGDKIKLTAWESKKLFGMLNEWKRQPLFDYNGDYKTQEVVTVKYKWLKLKATLDRLGIVKKLLRDMKTTNNLSKFIFQVWDYGYEFSMSFYNILCKFAYNEDFMVILDACQSTAPYPSCSYVMPPETIANTAKNRVMPVLDKIAEFHKKWSETQDPKIWLEGKWSREATYSLDAYSKMETSLQTEFEYLQ